MSKTTYDTMSERDRQACAEAGRGPRPSPLQRADEERKARKEQPREEKKHG